MKKPNSTRLGGLSTGFLFMVLLMTPYVVAQSYTLTVHTDSSSYAGNQTIRITGAVSPPPGPNTAVYIQVLNSNGKVVIRGAPAVNGTTGSYAFDAVAGGTTSWTSGMYKLNATWGAYGGVIFATTTFTWSPTATTTTSKTSSTTTTTSSTSSTTSRSSTSVTSKSSTSSSTSQTSPSTITTSSSATSPTTTSTSASASGGGGIPEFPYQLLIASLFTALIVGSYLLFRRPWVRGGAVGKSPR